MNLPPEKLRELPPIERAVPRAQPPPPRSRAPREDILRLPKTSPPPIPPGSKGEGPVSPLPKPEDGPEGSRTPSAEAVPRAKKGGPLPFISQEDINELARKGYPEDLTGNDALIEDTEAFKFLPYGRGLFAKLNKNMRFPKLAEVTGLQGDVFLDFVINKDGSLGSIEIIRSSGYKILDDEVVRTIRDSAPFQPLPPEWNKDRIIIPVVGIFRIYYREIQ